MKSYEASATIDASPDAIWKVLTDAPAYAAWDSGVERVEGTLAPGETINVYSQANPGRAFPVKVTDYEPGRSMTWTGGMPLGLFKGVRTFSLEPQDGGATRFHMREEYTGPRDRVERLADDLRRTIDLLARDDERRRDRHAVAERAHEHAAGARLGERALRQVRVGGQRVGRERQRAEGADARADLAGELVALERAQRACDLVLELEPAP